MHIKKIESGREIIPKVTVVGESDRFYKKDGKWYCKDTDELAEVIIIDDMFYGDDDEKYK